ncbi:hypothetical protein KAFR_0A03550 [Kazachstania africana CBS 2517]|uniref:MICOS complex subunit MIC60 n=1 Tax=Kazachstania africana (strain ATCC 22294 / BCRC 22015 / CBS 2517 / CECT 1963 / NBRC 1671 / NRRL Y-8276) TaxID=1071382 RepID=H2AN40_KAZAF|nr:hypothetical protein KAFR_0A03550 [Kazachstania africana CBS 2517]CCF55790.1 hypothetical protein KAFR_0A03550 [Kazachstania africana CBS 2517]
MIRITSLSRTLQLSRKQCYSSINTGVKSVQKTKSHRFRNTLLTLSLGTVTFYACGIILTEYTDNRATDWFIDNVPFADSIIDTYDHSRLKNPTKLNQLSSYVTGSTIGIPVHRPLPLEGEKEENILKLRLCNKDHNDYAMLDKIINELNSIIQKINSEKLVMDKSQIYSISSSFNDLSSILEEFNDNLDANVTDAISEGIKNDITRLDKEFREQLAAKTEEIEESYNVKFERFKTHLEERTQRILETSLASNEANLRSKQENDIAALSIAQVKEFEKIVKSKVEQERSGKLANLDELDGSLANFQKSVDRLNKLLTKNVAITQLSSILNDMKDLLRSNEYVSISMNDKVNRLKQLNTLLKQSQKTSCNCHEKTGQCHCSNKSPKSETNCSCHAKKKPTLLDVAIDELEEISHDQKILSTEQLYNRWNMLERDFKTASLLPPNAGILGHFTAKLFSLLLVTKRGDNQKNDLDSIFARVSDYLKLSKLNLALEEVIKLEGWPRILCEEWICDARRKLEIKSLIDLMDYDLKTS